jgi:hypothetical protein
MTSLGAARAPDLIEPVIGYRQWTVEGNVLRSPFRRVHWRNPVARAHCNLSLARFALGHEPHDAPHPDCDCGIYALHNPRGGLHTVGDECPVWGAVALWGRIEAHDGGMRAQTARIVALADDPDTGPAQRRRMRRVARTLGVEVAPLRDLEAAAAHHGRPLAPGLLPAPSPSRPFEIDVRRTREQPAFRFVLEPRGGYVHPWGWWGREGSLPRSEPWRGAIGDVFALDDRRAHAVFARVDAKLRPAAEVQLRSWALEDGWRLEIEPGLLPLALPRAIADGRSMVCLRCDSASRVNYFVGTAFQQTRWRKSRCDCGGRRIGILPEAPDPASRPDAQLAG